LTPTAISEEPKGPVEGKIKQNLERFRKTGKYKKDGFQEGNLARES